MALFGALGEFTRQGKVVITGTATFSGAGVLALAPAALGLRLVDSVSAQIVKATAPTTSVITSNFAAGTLTFYGWMATAAGNTALTASTAGESFRYTIIGRRR